MSLRAIVFIALMAAQVAQQVRDAPVVPKGTAQIGGVVTTPDGTGAERPLRRVTVSLSSPDARGAREVTTDDQGRFLFTELPTGRYQLSAGRLGYVATNYGAKRIQGTGSPISIADGQRQLGLKMSMPKGAVITGTITDFAGQPISEARLEMQERVVEGGLVTWRRLIQGVSTDDRGVYRAYGLAPGTYLVTVTRLGMVTNPLRQTTAADVQWALAPRQPNSGMTSPPTSPLRTLATVYYPGVVDARQATPVSLGLGEEKSGINFSVQYVAVARVSGVLSRPDGRSPGGVTVRLDDPNSVVQGRKTATVSPSGEFTIEAVEPGSYVLVAQFGTNNGSFWLREPVEVTGRDVTGLAVTMRPAVTAAGRVVVDSGATAAPPNLTRVRIDLRSLSMTQFSMTNPSADGAFTMEIGGPGPYRFSASVPQAGMTSAAPQWMVQSITAGGRDVSDRAMDLPAGGSIDNVVVTLTDKISSLTGRLIDERGQPAPDYTVVVFPADPEFWVTRVDRTPRRARPATDGTFQFIALPPGDYYIAAAMDASTSDLTTASFLQELIPAAVKITIAVGEKKVQELKIK